MENLPKETLLTIINDLNNQLNKLKTDISNQDDKNEHIKFLNAKLLEKDDIIDEVKDELEQEKIESQGVWENQEAEIKRLNKIISKLQNTDTSSVSSDDTRSNMEKWNMTDKEKKNMIKFLKEKCRWTEEPTEIIWENKTYHVAGSSTRELHAEFRKWAQAHGITTKGQYRGIPCEPEFKKYVVAKHKAKYSNQPWRCSDTNQFPKFYNGSNTTPRINLKINM
jgi:seryl-tRNA synthetase